MEWTARIFTITFFAVISASTFGHKIRRRSLLVLNNKRSGTMADVSGMCSGAKAACLLMSFACRVTRSCVEEPHQCAHRSIAVICMLSYCMLCGETTPVRAPTNCDHYIPQLTQPTFLLFSVPRVQNCLVGRRWSWKDHNHSSTCRRQ